MQTATTRAVSRQRVIWASLVAGALGACTPADHEATQTASSTVQTSSASPGAPSASMPRADFGTEYAKQEQALVDRAVDPLPPGF